ncbi:MAG TPA: MBL fold metallo-hydrolase [Candidatus Dormibacteraeota bacterium]|nr:MBL fold metallo-hydrolase [Candidatus Dormibacteraeota bacterium]
MEITHIGLGCLRLRGREAEVLVDPIDEGVARGLRLPRLDPDIVVRTRGRTDPALLRPEEGRPQTVSGPGEYELRGVRITGHAAGSRTIMGIVVDDVRVVSLGDLDGMLDEEVVEALGHVDILAVPTGGGGRLSAIDAVKVVNTVEPFIVVPTHYRLAGVAPDLDPVERFAKEMGLQEGWTAQPKLVLTGSSGPTDETRVVVLEPRIGAG